MKKGSMKHVQAGGGSVRDSTGTRNGPAGNGGAALIAAIIFLVVTSFLGLSLAFVFRSHMAADVNAVSSLRAFYVAEGGLEKGIRSYKDDCSGYEGETGSLGGGTFTVQKYTTDFSGADLPSGKRRIRSTGMVGQSTRIVEEIVPCGSGSASPRAITGSANIVMQHSSLIDCGEGYTPRYCQQEEIDDGSCPCGRELTPLPGVPSVPTPQPGPPPSGCTLQKNRVFTWGAGTYYCPSFTMQNKSKVGLTGPVTLYCGTFTMQNNTDMNVAGPPNNLLVIVSGSTALQNSSVFKGALYIGGSFTSQNSSEIYGTVGVKGSGVIQNSSEIHYEGTAGDASPVFYDIYRDPNVYWQEFIQ